jgi:RNA polymerase sigma-70 factor, ECF subfamily
MSYLRPCTVSVDVCRQGAMDLDQLFREHAAVVARVATSILGSSDDIKDLVQDVFLDACQDWRAIRDPSAVRAWLLSCTAHRSFRVLRRRKLRRLLGLDQAIDHEEVPAPSAPPEARATLIRIYQTLDGTAPRDRVAWVLHRMHGETLEAAAAICGCSLATVKRRVARVDLLVRQRLG